MLEEEDRPKKVARFEPLKLDPLNVADLKEYIEELRNEIARAEAAIARKHGARGDADKFFKF
ncbi:MAG TPA: DUF1192 family protein [Acetobacteraceae bacterium]|nr:DUF1192 family protein [Acetobacteraceae bacterium]